MSNDTEIRTAPWALRLGKGLYFFIFHLGAFYESQGANHQWQVPLASYRPQFISEHFSVQHMSPQYQQ